MNKGYTNKVRNNYGLLNGYRVLDLSEGACLFCGKILGDLGADVIKVEPPGGSGTRNYGPYYKDITDPEKSLYWFAYNTNKRSITLDIERSDGKELFKRLAKNADFVIESFFPGYLNRLDLGFDSLNEINPRLIMTSITPFGQTGPHSHYKGSELVVFAKTGFMSILGKEGEQPLQISLPQAFTNAATEAAVGTMAAHYHRELTGEGQHVDVSAQECGIALLAWGWQAFDMLKFVMPQHGGSFISISSDTRKNLIYPCKDGFVVLYMGGGSARVDVKSSHAMVKWMAEEGMAPDWLKNMNFAIDFDASKLTQKTINRVESCVRSFVKTKTKSELFKEAGKRGIMLAQIYNFKEVYEDPHLKYREFWSEVNHQELNDTIHYCGPFVRMSNAPIRVRYRPPLIGEHNRDIYEDELGLSKEEILILKQANII